MRNLYILIKRKAVGEKFEEEWRSDEALGTKGNTIKDSEDVRLCYKVCTVMSQSQKPCTVIRMVVHPDRANTLGARLPMHRWMVVHLAELAAFICFVGLISG